MRTIDEGHLTPFVFEPLIPFDETARVLLMSDSQLRRRVRDKEIRFVRIGRRLSFRPQDVADFVERHLDLDDPLSKTT